MAVLHYINPAAVSSSRQKYAQEWCKGTTDKSTDHRLPTARAEDVIESQPLLRLRCQPRECGQIWRAGPTRVTHVLFLRSVHCATVYLLNDTGMAFSSSVRVVSVPSHQAHAFGAVVSRVVGANA
eukprot:4944680-Pyramimonas_sp.AAC.2